MPKAEIICSCTSFMLSKIEIFVEECRLSRKCTSIQLEYFTLIKTRDFTGWLFLSFNTVVSQLFIANKRLNGFFWKENFFGY